MDRHHHETPHAPPEPSEGRQLRRQHECRHRRTQLPPLVELAYTFDRLSNITSKTDARTGSNRKRDYEYTPDGLMRLLTARRGEAGSTFADAAGGQRFEYDFLGNLRGFDTDINGDGSYSTANDQFIDGAFNAVNEPDNYVEAKPGGTATFQMDSDAAGNMTYRETVAGGNRLTYKHDRWGRLTQVWFTSGAPGSGVNANRAVYRYNGLSMRCLVERDSNTSDSTNALSERRAIYYGAGWQILEEHVDADMDDDYDRLAQNVWGLRYIDDLVLRRANANWNAGADTDFSDAGDTDWEQFLNDHQFSVVAGVNRSGTLTFRLAYDAYGEARHSWAKDIDGDGDVDAADGTIANGASGKQIHQSGYNADADWNRDGTVNSTDIAAFGSAYYATALAGGLLASSTSDFNAGFCAYRFNAELGAYTVRFRHYDPTPGVARWLERDPAGYVDGPSLSSYLSRCSHQHSDPFGLMAWYDELLDWTANVGASIGDSLSFEITRGLRSILGLDNIDTESIEYQAGWWTTTVVTVLWTGGVRLSIAGVRASAMTMYGFVRLGKLLIAPGKLGKAVLRFFYDARAFSTISKAYWAARGGATTAAGVVLSLDHWLIPQSAGRLVPSLKPFVNAGFNLVVIPRSLNSLKGSLSRNGVQAAKRIPGLVLEWGFKLAVPAKAAQVFEKTREACPSE